MIEPQNINFDIK